MGQRHTTPGGTLTDGTMGWDWADETGDWDRHDQRVGRGQTGVGPGQMGQRGRPVKTGPGSGIGKTGPGWERDRRVQW